MGRSRGVICRAKTIRCWSWAARRAGTGRWRALLLQARALCLHAGPGAAQCDRAGFPSRCRPGSTVRPAASQAQIERAAHYGVGAQHRRAALAKGGLSCSTSAGSSDFGATMPAASSPDRPGHQPAHGYGRPATHASGSSRAGGDHGAQTRRCPVVLGLRGEEGRTCSAVRTSNRMSPSPKCLAKKCPD